MKISWKRLLFALFIFLQMFEVRGEDLIQHEISPIVSTPMLELSFEPSEPRAGGWGYTVKVLVDGTATFIGRGKAKIKEPYSYRLNDEQLKRLNVAMALASRVHIPGPSPVVYETSLTIFISNGYQNLTITDGHGWSSSLANFVLTLEDILDVEKYACPIPVEKQGSQGQFVDDCQQVRKRIERREESTQ